MSSNSIPNSSIATASNVKKKRAKGSAKLKQCKLDARRQQWLSQVKNKGCKEEHNGVGEMRDLPMHACSEGDQATRELEVTPTNGEKDGSISDSDSSSNSPSSHTGSVVESNCSGTNFSGSSRSDSHGTSYSKNISEVEDDGGLDDWEAVADALAATDDKKDQRNQKLESLVENKNVTQLDHLPEVVNQPTSSADMSKPKPNPNPNPEKSQGWSRDDAFCPQSLPNLLKQHSFPMKSNMHYHHRDTTLGCKNFVSAPSTCPICCEDMDITDSSFLPCSCGFQLCLFCHKRILEEDGRCPGCRKHYDNNAVKWGENSDLDGVCATLQLARSSSMI